MLETTNYQFKKPELADSPPDITVMNPNWDSIDAKLKANEEQTNHLDADVVAHKAESASKHITESGSNANGRYLKFDDGTMICTRIIEATIISTTTQTYTYPATFVEAPSVGGNPVFNATNSGQKLDALDTLIRQTGASWQIVTGSRTYDTAMALLIFAIGRWK